MLAEWLRGFADACASWGTGAVLLRLLLATIVGLVIGFNRGYHNKGAGIKTHVLVCLGSAMAMIVNQYVLVTFPGTGVDVSRIGAQVISGVGFLGVGTIIVTGKNEVRGLTTAAGLWACACIGLAAGIGYAEGTVLALIFVLLTFSGLNLVDKHLRRLTRSFDLYVEFEDRSGVKEFLKKLHSWDCSYDSFVLSKSESGTKSPAATVTIKLPQIGRKAAFIEGVQMLDFVSFCEEI